MKTKMLLIVMGLMVVFFYSSAQQVTKTTAPSSVDANAKVKATPIVIKSNPSSGSVDYKEGLEGTPGTAYLNPEWQQGVIIMNDKIVIENIPMRYNLFTQQIQFIKDGDTVAIGNPEDIQKIRIADKEFVFNEYLDGNIVKTGYFELRQDGNCRLLKRWKAIYQMSDETNTPKGASAENDVFITDCHCYLRFGNQPAFAVSHNKKELIESFGDKSDRVKDFMKKSDIRLKKEQDLKIVIGFYNSLE